MANALDVVDPEVAEALRNEWQRQVFSLDLIASNNFAGRAVMEVQGTVLHNRSAEGYPGSRFHSGAMYQDVVENLARERAKELFSAEHANVQPNSGVCANMAVYFATVKPGDPILAMDLAHGGHLSHGHPASFSGRLFKVSLYGVDRESELIDYEQVMALAVKDRPRLIVCGCSSYPRTIDFAKFREIADSVGAYLWADVTHYAGLIAGRAYSSPVPHSDFVTFTTYKTMRGCRGGVILCRDEFAQRIDAAVFPSIQGTSHYQLVAGKAVTFRLAMTQRFREWARQVVANSRVLAETLQEQGCRVVSGGSDSHIVLVDLTNQNLTGQQAQDVLENVGIATNKNAIPFDARGALLASGVRLGTSAMTSRGFREPEWKETGDVLATVLANPEDPGVLRTAEQRVRHLCLRFPPYLDSLDMAAASLDS